MRNRQPGMSPAKIAIAVAVTMAAIAGIGAMKNVTGTSRAVAIVAVKPGIAPTKSPNTDAASITTMLYGSITIENACSQAPLIFFSPSGRLPDVVLEKPPRQRDPQELVERRVDDERQHERDRQVPLPAHAERGEQHGEVDDARGDEAE